MRSFSNDRIKYRMIDHSLSQIFVNNKINKEYENNISDDNHNINSKDEFIFVKNKIKTFSIQHYVVYASSLKIFLDHPIIGIGPKMFREICKENRYRINQKDLIGFVEDGSKSATGCQSHSHNTYIQLLVETGIVGFLPVFITFLFVCYIFIIHLFRRLIKKERFLSNFQICLYTSVFISLWPLVPTGNFFHNWLSIIYFMPIGFIISTYDKRVNTLKKFYE